MQQPSCHYCGMTSTGIGIEQMQFDCPDDPICCEMPAPKDYRPDNILALAKRAGELGLKDLEHTLIELSDWHYGAV